MWYKKYIIIVLFGVVACHPVRHPYVGQASTPAAMPDQSASYVFRIVTTDTSKASTISLMTKSITAGSVKPHHDPTPFPSRLTVTQEDASSRVLDLVTFQHPLFKMTEYVTARNELDQKISSADQAEFFVRLPLRSSAIKLQIEEFRQNRSLGKTYFELK